MTDPENNPIPDQKKLNTFVDKYIWAYALTGTTKSCLKKRKVT